MKKRKKLSLKQEYYRTFAGLIVLPLLIVLAVSLLILGKGHEDYQIIGHTKHHLDDLEEVKKYLGLM